MTEILFGNEIPWIWSIWCFIRTCHWFLGNASFFDDFIILSVDMALLNLAVYKNFIFSFYLKQRRISTNINCVDELCRRMSVSRVFFASHTLCVPIKMFESTFSFIYFLSTVNSYFCTLNTIYTFGEINFRAKQLFIYRRFKMRTKSIPYGWYSHIQIVIGYDMILLFVCSKKIPP